MIISIEAEGYFDKILSPFIILKTLNQVCVKESYLNIIHIDIYIKVNIYV